MSEEVKTKPVRKALSKKAKVALIAVSGVVLLAGGITAGIFSNQILDIINRWDDDIAIANVNDECKTEIGEFEDDEEGLLPYKYLGSTETKPSHPIEGYEDSEVLSAHTFLIGRVASVPFYNSAWIKFDYENIGIRITYSQITTTSIANSLGSMQERTQSTHWKESSKFEEKFYTSAKGGIGPIKLNAENTINYQMTTEMESELSSKYVSSSEQTTTSIETLQKSSDYSIQLNSKNGFKKGKYYRLTLQQTASMYMVIYENSAKETTNDSNAKFYELVSYLANPSDYVMVIEEADEPDPKTEKTEEEKFDPYLYEDCANWIEQQREDELDGGVSRLKWIITEEDPVPPTRKEILDPYFKDVDRVESDLYVRNYARSISDVGKTNNYSDRVTFPTLFKSKKSPTFAELFNSPNEPDERYQGYGFKFVDLEIQLNAYQKDDGNAHVILVDKDRNNIKEWKEDLPDDCSIKQYHYKYEGLDALNKLRTTIVPSKADGWIEIMYDASGKDFDWWVNQDFTLKVWIYK
ncbi:MAG: hypothetical protein MJ214_01205 [Bacilli bacterium]|nr:hypothetical protein [Bacilli bacterium]